MANVVWPQSLCPRTFSLQLVADVRNYPSTFGGSEIVTDMSSDFWTAFMEIDSRSGSSAAQLEALVNYLQGGINTAEFGHFARTLPNGTIALATLTATDSAKGSYTIRLNATTGATVKTGDLFSVGGLLLMCSQDAVASAGVIDIPLVNRLRIAIPANMTANFSAPRIKFRLDSESSVNQLIGYSAPVSLSFVEDI